jgi:hypothetical protein
LILSTEHSRVDRAPIPILLERMPISDPTGSTVVELSRAEQWVVHHVLLAAVGLADGESSHEDLDEEVLERNLDVIEKVEAGRFEFTPAELSLLKQACGDHARRTRATADRNLASAVADRIEATVEDTASAEE